MAKITITLEDRDDTTVLMGLETDTPFNTDSDDLTLAQQQTVDFLMVAKLASASMKVIDVR